MTFVTTFGAFSVRGFGGMGANPPPPSGSGYLGYSDGIIVDCVLDSSNNLIGMFRLSDNTAKYKFSFQPNTVLNYWVSYSNDIPVTMIIDDSDNVIVGGSIFSGIGGRLQYYGSSIYRSNYTYTDPIAGTAFRTFSQIGLNTSGQIIAISPNTSAYTYIATVQASTGNLTAARRMLAPYICPFKIRNFSTGFYHLLTTGSGAGTTASVQIGVANSTLTNGTYKLSNSTIYQLVVGDSDLLYFAGSVGNYVNLTCMNSSYTISYTISSNVAGGQPTGIAVDDANEFIYVSYTQGGAGAKDRISKFTITGTHVWTRSLAQTSGVALGVKKLLVNSYGTILYLITNTIIFEISTDGEIPGDGTYTAGGIDYTYAIAPSWATTSVGALTLGASTSTWTTQIVYGTGQQVTAMTPTIASQLINWVGLV